MVSFRRCSRHSLLAKTNSVKYTESSSLELIFFKDAPYSKKAEAFDIILGERELFLLRFFEIPFKTGFEVIGSITEQVMVQMELLSLSTNKDVYHTNGEKSISGSDCVAC